MDQRRLLMLKASLAEMIETTRRLQKASASMARRLKNDDDLSYEGMALDFAKDDFNEVLDKLNSAMNGVEGAIERG